MSAVVRRCQPAAVMHLFTYTLMESRATAPEGLEGMMSALKAMA